MSSEVTFKSSSILKSRERIQTRIFQIAEDASIAVAQEIAEGIRAKAASGASYVLGLSAGSAFQRVYEELISLHKGGLSFANVVVFGLEEYLPMGPTQLQSLNYRIKCALLDHVDLRPENIHLLDGTVAHDEAQAQCDAFEGAIEAAGGLDYMLITVGGDGHVGFNLPDAGALTRTRTLFIGKGMRIACASEFFGVKNVPLEAMSMGLGTVMGARRVAVMEFGEGRAGIVKRLVEEASTESITITRLQGHAHATVFCDTAAGATLTEMATPWLIGGASSSAEVVEFTPETTRKAVIWLSLLTGKSVLRLVDDDYREHQLSQLINAHRGNAHEVNLAVYHHLHRGMTGWPGGRTAEPPLLKEPLAHPTIPGEKTNYDVSIVPRKRVLVFSPHPDDDVISMGGTIIRLCDQGHEVHTVYMTSGNIAVFDDDAVRFCGYAVDELGALGITGAPLDAAKGLLARVKADALRKTPENSFMDSQDLLTVKRLIRQQEALSASRLAGVTEDHVHFLNLPFYQTGTVEKSPITEKDVQIVLALLREQRPQQIYAAGDLSDPHGTHRMCLKALLKAVDILRAEGSDGEGAWVRSCDIWLYRGAWQEWEPEKVEMTVPMSPDELYRKRLAIYRHQSQKDPAPFPGTDPREFWQRSEARNRATAQLFVKLGLPQFEALETFVRYNPDSPVCKALLN